MMYLIDDQNNKDDKVFGQECKGVAYVFRW